MHVFWKRLLPTAAGLMTMAMGCASSGPATPTPTATVMPPLETTHGPAIAFDKLWAELGTVARDQQGVQTFLVMNQGDSPLTGGPVNLEVLQGCDGALAPEGSVEAGPGETFFLPVRLGPHRETGPHRGPGASAFQRPLPSPGDHARELHCDRSPGAAGGRPAPGGVDKELVDIGVVPFDWPLFGLIVLRNDGDAPLVLEGTPVVRVEVGC